MHALQTTALDMLADKSLNYIAIISLQMYADSQVNFNLFLL